MLVGLAYLGHALVHVRFDWLCHHFGVSRGKLPSTRATRVLGRRRRNGHYSRTLVFRRGPSWKFPAVRVKNRHRRRRTGKATTFATSGGHLMECPMHRIGLGHRSGHDKRRSAERVPAHSGERGRTGGRRIGHGGSRPSVVRTFRPLVDSTDRRCRSRPDLRPQPGHTRRWPRARSGARCRQRSSS